MLELREGRARSFTRLNLRIATAVERENLPQLPSRWRGGERTFRRRGGRSGREASSLNVDRPPALFADAEEYLSASEPA